MASAKKFQEVEVLERDRKRFHVHCYVLYLTPFEVIAALEEKKRVKQQKRLKVNRSLKSYFFKFELYREKRDFHEP